MVPTDEEIKLAKAFADVMHVKLNSYDGTYRGELSELCLARMMGETHNVEHNDEKKTKVYDWDLKIDGHLVDVKTATSGYFTISSYILNNARKEILYPCYKALVKKFTLVGVLDGKQIHKLAKNSKFYSGYYVSSEDVRKFSKIK